MRPKTWGLLLTVGLVTAPASAQITVVTDRNRDEANARTWADAVVGYGKTYEDAHLAALNEARSRVADHLSRVEPTLRWTPSADDLPRMGMVSVKARGDHVPSGVGDLHKVELRVEVTGRHLKEVFARDHQERVTGRQVLTGKVLLGLVGLLAVFAGYFRLEEGTRGYYTGILRALVLACVLLISAAVWVIL